MRNIACLTLVALVGLFELGCGEGANSAGGPGGTGGSSGTGTTTGAAGSGGVTGTGGTGGGTPTDSCGTAPASARVDAWVADPHFCLLRYATNVSRPRQITFAPNGDLFVGTGDGRVLVLYDADGDGVSGTGERSTFATVSGGNHGVAVTSTHVYASSTSTVYRWGYAAGQRASMGMPETIVRGIGGGGHTSRTLLIDAQNRLYVSVGSVSNVDAPADPNTPPAQRALIRRYNLASVPAGGYDAGAGELFASGLRNEVGLAFDAQGRIWGVENGRDDLVVAGDANMYNDNPAEEVNLFDPARPGRNYGYPFCWSEGVWTGATAKGAGTQHLDPDRPGAYTEARCQDPNTVVPPAFPMRAHLAPLDIVEYTGSAYPVEFRGNLFVASHGSWNRDEARGHVGRIILRLKLDANGMPSQADNFLGELGNGGALREGSWSIRPVSIREDASGLLTFSDDASGTIHKIGYRP